MKPGGEGSHPLLETREVRTWFPVRRGIVGRTSGYVKAVDGVSLCLAKGETLGLVGESGCGKTTLGRTIVGLEHPHAGHIYLNGKKLTALSGRERKARSRLLQMVFQDPYASLNPRMTVLDILVEGLTEHRMRRGSREEEAERLLAEVGLPPDALYRYPFEFSGGQRQRISLARAVSLRPSLVVCDEPVSSLDVSVQAQAINLLMELREKHDLAYLFISHDLGVVKHLSDRIAVMYLGKVVEMSLTEAIFNDARHPYTQALLGSAPMVEPVRRRERVILKGNVPNPANPPSGCPFHPRCPVAIEICSHVAPPLIDTGRAHLATCHLATAEKAN